MATILAISDKLLDRARRISGCRTKKETVQQALREYIQRREAQNARPLFAPVQYQDDCGPACFRK